MSQSNTSSLPPLQVASRGSLLVIPLSNELLSFKVTPFYQNSCKHSTLTTLQDLRTFVGFFYFPNARQYSLSLYGRLSGSLVLLGEENWNREFVLRLVTEGGGYILAHFHSVIVHPPIRLHGQRIPTASESGSFQARPRQAQSRPTNDPANTQALPRRPPVAMPHVRTSQSPLRPESVRDSAKASHVESMPSDAVKSPSGPGHSQSMQQPTAGNAPPDSAPCPNAAAGKTPTVQSTLRRSSAPEPDPSRQQPTSQSETSKASNVTPVLQTEAESTLPYHSKNKNKNAAENPPNPISVTSKEKAVEQPPPDLSSQAQGRDEDTPAAPHERASASVKAAATGRNIVDLTATTQGESEDDEPTTKRLRNRNSAPKKISKIEHITLTFVFDCQTKNFVPLEQAWKGFTSRYHLDTDYKKVDDSIWSRLELQLADTPLSVQEQKDHVSFDTYIDGRVMQMGDKLRDFIPDAMDSTEQSCAGEKRPRADFGRNRAFGTVRLWLGPKDKSEEKFKFDTYADYEQVKKGKTLVVGDEDRSGKAV